MRGWLQTSLPSNPAKCLNSDGKRTEVASFPSVSAEDGPGRNQNRHLLHVVLGPRAVSSSSMEQTCLLLCRLVCGEQQTLGREGDKHRYRFLIIKHQEPWVRAGARSRGVLTCRLPSTGLISRVLFSRLPFHIRTELSQPQYSSHGTGKTNINSLLSHLTISISGALGT